VTCDKVIPLPPIAFYTRKYCKQNGIEYQTENTQVTQYLSQLSLEEYIGKVFQFCHITCSLGLLCLYSIEFVAAKICYRAQINGAKTINGQQDHREQDIVCG